MKTRILLILFCTQTFCFIVSFQIFAQSRQNLVGVWEFVELLDQNNRKIDTIRHAIGWEIASGPVISFKKNGTYSKRFTPKNIDYGTWTYSEDDKVIVYRLNLNKEEDAKLLVENGLAKTDKKGRIYQEIKDSVISLNEDILILYAHPERKKVYKRVTSRN